MCWISKHEISKCIANKNIKCYKNFKLKDIKFKQKSIFKFKFGKKKIIQLISLFEKYLYIPYKEQPFIDLKPIRIYDNIYYVENHKNIYYRIDTGYHSYSTIEKAKGDIWVGNEIVVKCIIPKGTEYYINTNGEIVSSTIIVTDQIVY